MKTKSAQRLIQDQNVVPIDVRFGTHAGNFDSGASKHMTSCTRSWTCNLTLLANEAPLLTFSFKSVCSLH